MQGSSIFNAAWLMSCCCQQPPVVLRMAEDLESALVEVTQGALAMSLTQLASQATGGLGIEMAETRFTTKLYP